MTDVYLYEGISLLLSIFLFYFLILKILAIRTIKNDIDLEKEIKLSIRQKTNEQLSGLNINDVLTKVLGVQHGTYKPVYNEYNQEIARKYANDNDVYVHQNRVARLPADPDFPKRLEYKEYIVHRDYYKIEQKTDDYQTYVLRDGNNLTVRYVYSE